MRSGIKTETSLYLIVFIMYDDSQFEVKVKLVLKRGMWCFTLT